MLFPLPLTPFEYYYLSDDRPAYPTTYPVDMRLSGELEREPFLLAVRQALERHPLLNACIDDSGPMPQWVPSPELPSVNWADESVPITHPDGEYIDLRTRPGLRVFVRTRPGGAQALFQFHHACCDGLASFRFGEDVFICYRRIVGGADAEPTLPPIDVELLKRRNVFALTENYRPSLPEVVRDQWITARVWSNVMLNRAAALAVPKVESNGNGHTSRHHDLLGGSHGHGALQPILQFQTASITSDQSRELRRVARSQGASLNDLLLRDLFLAMRRWNGRHQVSSQGTYRVNVPVNLRDRTDRTMPATNRLSFAFVSKSERQCRDRSRLLATIRQDTHQIKDHKLGFYFYGGLALAHGMPSMVPWALHRKFPFATMVLSNLGRVYSRSALPGGRSGKLTSGNVVLDRLTGVPPLRPLTRAGIAIVDYGGESTINLRCDPHLYSTADARALLDLYVDQLLESLRLGT